MEISRCRREELIVEKDRAFIAFIEQLAANTWPSIVQQAYGGWKLRAAEGVTRRANSVWTCGDLPEGNWREEVNAFYSRRGLPVCYQISPASPPELDRLLELEGYRKEMVTTVMISSIEKVRACLNPPEDDYIILHSGPSGEWIDDFIAFEQFPVTRKPVYEKMFAAIGPRHTFLTLKNAREETIGVGTAIVERGWAGYTNVVIAPPFRRQGAGRRLVRALADWSGQNGASNLYLQVSADNEPAIALYTRSGYRPLYQYHYRIGGG